MQKVTDAHSTEAQATEFQVDNIHSLNHLKKYIRKVKLIYLRDRGWPRVPFQVGQSGLQTSGASASAAPSQTPVFYLIMVSTGVSFQRIHR